MAQSIRQQRHELAVALRQRGLTWPKIGEALRQRWPELSARAALRIAHCWTQQDVADEWIKRWPNDRRSGKEIGLWENWPVSGRRPSLGVLDKLAELYQCSIADVLADVHDHSNLDQAKSTGAAPEAGSGQRPDGDAAPGRALTHTVTAAGVTVAGGLAECWDADYAAALSADLSAERADDPAEVAGRIAHQWLVTPPPQTVELTAGRRVGETMAAKLERRVVQLRHIDDFVGGRDLQVLVERELAVTRQLINEATYHDTVGRRLLVAVAELCWLAGWVAADAGHPQRATVRYLAGIKAAHAAGDRAGAANLISTIAYHLTNTGNPADGIVAARTAIAGSAGHATATTRALLHERAAWAHACAGQADLARAALDTVEADYQERDPDQDPEWVYWLDRDEIDIMAARCLLKIGHPTQAIDMLTGVVARYNLHKTRELALYTSWLSEAHIEAGNIDQAATHATRTAQLTTMTASARSDERVQTLATKLSPYRSTPAVRHFIDTIHTPN